MRPASALFLFLLCCFVACTENGKPETQDSATTSTPADEPPNFSALLNTWAEAMSDSDNAALSSLYADSVMYYGIPTGSSKVFMLQSDYVTKHKGYKLRITEIDLQEHRPDNSWYIHFTKEVTTAADTVSYPSSLVFAWKSNGWKIIGESDDLTDIKGAAENYILNYAPAISNIEGVIEENSSWNTSTPGSDPKSDGRMVYYVLIPKKKITTVAGFHNNPPAEENIDRVQLRSKIDLRNYVNKTVVVSGRMLHSTGSGINTVIQMDVLEVR
jgi:ketosteroid isomerase-like protein